MLSPEYYAYKRVRNTMEDPIAIGGSILGLLALLAGTLHGAVQGQLVGVFAGAGIGIYMLLGATYVRLYGSVFILGRAIAIERIRGLVANEIERQPALDLAHMQRFADNERSINTTAEVIYLVLDEYKG